MQSRGIRVRGPVHGLRCGGGAYPRDLLSSEKLLDRTRWRRTIRFGAWQDLRDGPEHYQPRNGPGEGHPGTTGRSLRRLLLVRPGQPVRLRLDRRHDGSPASAAERSISSRPIEGLEP
jgi:hypothetical protein